MGKFQLGDGVQKARGSNWRGTVCGVYSGSQTSEGYAVESVMEPGNVQIYPAAALLPWDGLKAAPDREAIITTLRRFAVRNVYIDRQCGRPRYAVFEGSNKLTASVTHREACDLRDGLIADAIIATMGNIDV